MVNLTKEQQFRIEITKIENRAKSFTLISRTFLRTAGYVIIACFIFLSIKEIAGKTTIAEIIVDFFANVKIRHGIGYAVGIFSLIYAFLITKLRRKVITRYSKRLEKLEKMINPNRKSSELTVNGKTKKEDKEL